MSTATVAYANPWTRLPRRPPYVLDEDAALVAAFNARAKPEHRIDMTLLPEPFVGRHDAPVVLLNLNPGWKPSNAATHSQPHFVARSRGNLEQAVAPYPFFLLDPTIQAHGILWWSRKLRQPIVEVGLEAVANGVLCVEYFPYHSWRYGSRPPRVPSQEFSFELLRQAIEREAVIVVMRSKRRWEAVVPELVGYSRRVALRNVQNPCVSPGNCKDGYETIVSAIS
jgi:hypothetical protein